MINSLESYQIGMETLLKTQLAYYGEIDRQVVAAHEGGSAKDAEVLNTVEQLLPNTTAFGQAGWSAELQQFLRERARVSKPLLRSNPVQFPTFEGVVENWDAMTSEFFPSGSEGPIPTQSVEIATAYPSMILEKINQIKGEPGGELGEPLAKLNTYSKFVEIMLPDGVRAIRTIDDWTTAAKARNGVSYASRSRPCFGLLEEVEGQYCSSIYTDHVEPGLEVADIKAILNPLNWPDCCTFFREVQPQDPPFTGNTWSRILETIGPEPDEYLIDTALLFYYGEFDDGSGGIYLNYDIDTTKQRDTGLVEVDSGYIYVTPMADGSGVRIRTSKQERVNGLSPTATSALACFFGWGEIGRHMLAGTARAIKLGTVTINDPKPFETSEVAFKDFETKNPSPSALKVPGPKPAVVSATLPPNFGDTVDDARKLANDLVDRVAGSWGGAMNRWLDGLTGKDVDVITRDAGTQLNEFARAVYDTAQGNVMPQRAPTASADGAAVAEEGDV